MDHSIFQLIPKIDNKPDYDWLIHHGAEYGLLVTADNDQYIVVKMVSPDLAKTRLENWETYRSLFIDRSLNVVICRTLDSGLSLAEFSSEISWDDMIIEEFIEGTQIQVYWDCRNRLWSFGTRGRMDLDHRWDSNKTFLEMFIELVDLDVLVDRLNTDYSYSFVLQHPDNRIVIPINEPRIVHVESRNMRTGRCENIELGIEKPRRFKMPREYDDDLGTIWDFIPQGNNWGEDLQKHINDNCPWQTGGYMLWNSTHTMRCHIKPAVYQTIRGILDSIPNPNIRYRLMCLIRDNRWSEIALLVDSLPHIQADYHWANRKFSHCIRMIYDTYYDIFVHKKMIVMSREQWMARHLLYRIHGIYLTRAKTGNPTDIDIFDILDAVMHRCSHYEFWNICKN